jgi:hypothetical protein
MVLKINYFKWRGIENDFYLMMLLVVNYEGERNKFKIFP